MQQSILTLYLLLICCFASAQHKDIRPIIFQPTKAQVALIKKYEQCTNLHRYKAAERRAFFPFGDAVKIRLITYEGGPEPNPDIQIDEPGSPPRAKPIELPIPAEDTMKLFITLRANEFNVNYCKVFELRDLSAAGVDSLTDILYNVGYTPVKNLPGYPQMGYSCYEPRNAILFLNAGGKVMQYIEFCFGCKRYYYSSSKTQPIEYCEQKFDMLKAFYSAQGLKYSQRH